MARNRVPFATAIPTQSESAQYGRDAIDARLQGGSNAYKPTILNAGRRQPPTTFMGACPPGTSANRTIDASASLSLRAAVCAVNATAPPGGVVACQSRAVH